MDASTVNHNKPKRKAYIPPIPTCAEEINPVFAKHQHIVSKNPDDFLLTCHYSPDMDELYIVYKSYSTGKRRIDVIQNPPVPIFLSKIPQRYNKEVLEFSKTDKSFIPYKNKKEELRTRLFDHKVVRYRDKRTNQLVQKTIFTDVPPNAEYLHPNLYMGDILLENWVLMDYTFNRYDNRYEHLLEHIPIPELFLGSFDIETTIDDDGILRINTNTFIDYKSKKAYIDYWDRPDFNRVDELRTKTEEFKQTVKKTLYDAIESCNIKDKQKREKIQKMCHEMTDDLEIIVRRHTSEESLILQSTYTMFTESDVDILVAFNAPYDLGKFAERVLKLGLPLGTLSKQGLQGNKYKDVPALYTQKIMTRQGNAVPNWFKNDEGNYVFRGDQIYPSKRTVFLPVLTDKLVLDLAVIYYSARQNAADVASYSLDSTAMATLGFGKFDYSHITDSITKLARADFWFHSIYALIDSILLPLINKAGNEIESAISYEFRTKTTLYETPSNNLAIPLCDFADAYVKGYVFGNNVNKVLRTMSMKEVSQISKVLNFDYTKRAYDVKNKSKNDYSGGLVSQPKYWINQTNLLEEYGLMNKEFYPTTFTMILLAAYLDFKSHYPNQKITRNVAMETLIGQIEAIVDSCDGSIYKTVVKLSKEKLINGEVVDNLGQILLTLVNRNIIAYANQTINLPSMSELANRFIPFDSKPIFEPLSTTVVETFKKPRNLDKFLSVLTDINRKTLPKEDESDAELKDNRFYLLNNGAFVYYGTLVEYRYHNKSVFDYIDTDYKPTGPLYGHSFKSEILVDNNQLQLSERERYVINKDFKPIPMDVLEEISKATVFTRTVYLDGCKLALLDRNIYFPFKKYKFDELYDPNKDVVITHPEYRIVALKETYRMDITYNITYKDVIGVTIIQSLQLNQY